jgi:hypothetical protein
VTLALFAGLPVSDYSVALAWCERLLGAPPSFFPNDTEAVWEVASDRYLYIDAKPEHPGHALCTLFVTDLEARLESIASRDLVPFVDETYRNGVRKVTYRDPDGNQIALAGSSPQ